jgi:nuclear GTP-binding protein
MFNKLPEEKQRELEQKRNEEESRKRKRSETDQLSSMVKSANKRERQFEEQEALIKNLGQFNMKGMHYSWQFCFTTQDSSKKAFFTEFRKVVKASDVIIEVLDARDPLGSRSIAIERSILGLDPNKKIILLLNKIGMVPFCSFCDLPAFKILCPKKMWRNG